MKKRLILIVGMLCIMVTSLTSCQVNWFDRQYDVHWWVIAIPMVVFSAVVLVAVGLYISSKKYVCPKCRSEFYPKWWKAAVSMHINDKRLFKCPNCGEKSFCKISTNKEER